MLTQRSHDSWKYVCVIPALLVALAGCVTTGDKAASNPFAGIFSPWTPKDLSPEEREMRDDAKVFRDTVLGGGVLFGTAAGITCLVKIGPDDADALKKCAVVATIAAIVGALDGYRTARKQEASRQKVREIDIVTQEIEERNAGIRKLVESSRKVVEQNRERIEEVKGRVAQSEEREKQLAQERKRLQSNIGVMNKTIDTLMQDRLTYQKLADQMEQDGESVAALRSQVESMNLQIAALEEERDALDEINQSIEIA